ncbi:MAG TPA: glycoside hydrolase family 28 protein [Candidatus Angelobacter sp.]|nr:glycoside hydrolase family 28 protein [Candidatus Angelobacter sp.]
MKFIAGSLTLLLGAILCSGAESAQIFNVRAFGAKGDGATLDTAAIQKALDACANSGGTVEFPAGTYLSQPLKVRSRTTVMLDAGATLQACTNQAAFMKVPGDWLKAKSSGEFMPFIGGEKLHDVTFTGSGVIDGGGAAWWGEAEKAREIKPGYTLPRPNLIGLEQSTNLRFENITLQNSPKFHLVPSDCENVVISNVTILAPEHAANTDAIDPSGRHMLITKCRIDVGDDDIAIKAGKKVAGQFQSEDITVTDCTFLHGHGMSIGSETSGGVRNVSVKNCTFENTENGLRIKSDGRRGGIVENISYSDITMSNVAPAITFTCFYMNNSSGDANRNPKAQAETPSSSGQKLPTYRDIRITNLRATCQKNAGSIVGMPNNCISNVVFENVHISAPKGMTVRNAQGIEFRNSKILAADGVPFRTENARIETVENSAQK